MEGREGATNWLHGLRNAVRSVQDAPLRIRTRDQLKALRGVGDFTARVSAAGHGSLVPGDRRLHRLHKGPANAVHEPVTWNAVTLLWIARSRRVPPAPSSYPHTPHGPCAPHTLLQLNAIE